MKKIILTLMTFIILAQSNIIYGNSIGKILKEKYLIIHNNLEHGKTIHICHAKKTGKKGQKISWDFSKAYCRIKPGGSRRFTGKGTNFVIKTNTHILGYLAGANPITIQEATHMRGLNLYRFGVDTFGSSNSVYVDNTNGREHFMTR